MQREASSEWKHIAEVMAVLFFATQKYLRAPQMSAVAWMPLITFHFPITCPDSTCKK